MASLFHHLLAALCFADLLFLISLVVVSPVSMCICIIILFLYFVILVTMMMMITIVVIHTNTILYLV